MDEVDLEKHELLKKKEAGDALRELQLHHGWKHFIRILQDEYNSAVEALIFKESPEDRAKIKAIETLLDQMDVKIQYAKVASEELSQEKFKNMPATS